MWAEGTASTREALLRAGLEQAASAVRSRRPGDLLSFRDFVDEVSPRYRWYRHCEQLGVRLQQVADGELNRLMVFMPPRHGKSEQISRLLPAYYLYRHPERWVGLNSYGAELAYDLSGNAREHFRRLDAESAQLSGDASAVKRWETTGGGGLWAAGVGGPIMGKGFHLGIIDDPLKNREEARSQLIREKQKRWYQSDFISRAEPDHAIILVMTRWHEDDLAGWLLGREDEAPEGWHIMDFEALADPPSERPDYPATCAVEEDVREPGEALCPERKSREELLHLKASVDAYFWASMWQQRPSPDEGGIFKRGWWRFHEFTDLPEFDELIQSWDMSFKGKDDSDFVVGQVWGRVGADKYLLAQVRDRMEFTEARDAVCEMTERWRSAKAKLVEDKANGPAIMSSLRKKISGLIPYDPGDSDKTARARAVTPQIRSGNVYIPDPNLFPWATAYIEEFAAFPNGAQDDQVDTTTQALDYLGEREREPEGVHL